MYKNLDPFFDSDKEPGPDYKSLYSYIADEDFGKVPPGDRDVSARNRVFLSWLDCIAELHAQGLVHWDIEPYMLYVLNGHNDGFVKYCECACPIGSPIDPDKTLLIGLFTPLDEKVLRNRYDPRVDVYGLGLAGLAWLCGFFRGHDDDEDEKPFVNAYHADEKIVKVLLKAAANAPDDRYPDAVEFAKAFREAIGWQE